MRNWVDPTRSLNIHETVAIFINYTARKGASKARNGLYSKYITIYLMLNVPYSAISSFHK
jgi:hypothetical protein